MFFIVFSKEKGNTSKISLSKDLIDMKAHNKHRVSVFRCFETVLVFPLLFTNRTSLEHKSLLSLFFFFSKIQASKLGVRLIYGLLWYVTLFNHVEQTPANSSVNEQLKCCEKRYFFS